MRVWTTVGRGLVIGLVACAAILAWSIWEGADSRRAGGLAFVTAIVCVGLGCFGFITPRRRESFDGRRPTSIRMPMFNIPGQPWEVSPETAASFPLLFAFFVAAVPLGILAFVAR